MIYNTFEQIAKMINEKSDPMTMAEVKCNKDTLARLKTELSERSSLYSGNIIMGIPVITSEALPDNLIALIPKDREDGSIQFIKWESGVYKKDC